MFMIGQPTLENKTKSDSEMCMHIIICDQVKISCGRRKKCSSCSKCEKK